MSFHFDPQYISQRLGEIGPETENLSVIVQDDDSTWTLAFENEVTVLVLVEWADEPARLVLSADIGTPPEAARPRSTRPLSPTTRCGATPAALASAWGVRKGICSSCASWTRRACRAANSRASLNNLLRSRSGGKLRHQRRDRHSRIRPCHGADGSSDLRRRTMGSKVGNNNPPQSRESLAYASEKVLKSSKSEENYLVGKKIKDKLEIDGVARGDITYLSHKSKKHGPAAAAYRLSARRKSHYKGARNYLEDLVAPILAEPTHFHKDQVLAAQSIERILRRSNSKGCIQLDGVLRKDLDIIIDGIKTEAQASAEAVTKDYGHDAGNISHFLDDVERIKSGKNSQLAREDIRKRGHANVQLLDQITLVNTWARTLKLQPQTVNRLKLKPRSFTAPATSPAGEAAGQNLLDKLADWPGSNLQMKLAIVFGCANFDPEYGSEFFKMACKEVLLELSEQKFILNSLSDEFLDTIDDEEDQEKLRALGQSVKKLLAALDSSDSPFKRLEGLVRGGYQWPKETARKVVEQRHEFLMSFTGTIPTDPVPPPVVNGQPVPVNGQLSPVNGQLPAGNGQPAANVPRTPGNVPGNSQGLRPLPAIPGAVLPVSGSVPSPSNLAQPAASVVPSALPSVPSVPNGPPPPLPGGKLQPATVNGVAVGSPPDDMPAPPPQVFNVPAASMPAPTSVGVATTKLSPIGAGPLVSGPLQPNIPSIPNDPLPPLPGGKLQPATVNGVAVGSPPDDMPAPPAALFIPPPPDDTPPPPSNVGQAAQPANNVVAAGAQPQSAISNVTLPSGLQPNAPSSPHAKPVIAGTLVKKRVDQILSPSPLMPTNPALSLTPSAKASPDMLPPANVDDGADMSVPPPEYMPPPRQDITPSNVNGSAAPANLSQSPDSSPRPVSLSQAHKDNLSKSDAEITDAIAQMNYNAPVLYKSQKSSGVADKAKLNFRIGALGEKNICQSYGRRRKKLKSI